MKVLRNVKPTPEQIALIKRVQAGVSLIRGAAGSGKTTTALMSLRASMGATITQLRNENRLPAKVLVLTYNRSLAGYMLALAQNELTDYADDVQLYIYTFDRWAFHTLGMNTLVDQERIEAKRRSLLSGIGRRIDFLMDEFEYVLGRFSPDRLNLYPASSRVGRGVSPPFDSSMRQQLLDQAIYPYLKWKNDEALHDFSDLALKMIEAKPSTFFDVVVVDETQDFSTNQLRAVMKHSASVSTITLVVDTAQRIYPRGTIWSEAGIKLAPGRSFRLTKNYRNSREIAELAASIVSDLKSDEDGSLPNPSACYQSGTKPKIIKGLFREQMTFAIDALKAIDLEEETVGFLHLKGGGWFNKSGSFKDRLDQAGIPYCELQGNAHWPEDGPNVALCTIHSAKGLEFDHVFILGLGQTQVTYEDKPDDDRLAALRRLLAMGVGRARKTVTLGFKQGEGLNIINDIDPMTYQEIIL